MGQFRSVYRVQEIVMGSPELIICHCVVAVVHEVVGVACDLSDVKLIVDLEVRMTGVDVGVHVDVLGVVPELAAEVVVTVGLSLTLSVVFLEG